MKKINAILIIFSGILLAISCILPSRLTQAPSNLAWEFFINFQLGYSTYLLFLLPIVVYLAFTKYLSIAYLLSLALLFTTNRLFDNLFNLFNSEMPFWDYGLWYNLLPFIVFVALGFFFIKKVIITGQDKWYMLFIGYVLISYTFINDWNCMIEFVGDMGIRIYDLSIWLSNCATFYAWSLSVILLNVGIYLRMKTPANISFDR